MKPDIQQPLVSAIIITRHRARLVSRAIHSVLKQSYQAIELIVVVDGPDPETVAIVAAILPPRSQLIELEHSVGPSEARNVGVRAARGEWIAFLDDDDEWFPSKTTAQVNAAASAGSHINLVHSRFEKRSAQETRLMPITFPREGEDWSHYFYYRAGLLIPSVLMVKRTTFITMPFHKTLRRGVDVDWFLRARAANLLSPCWTFDIVAVYHLEAEVDRVSTHIDWKGRYTWLMDNLPLVARQSVPYYIAMLCIPEAKRSDRPLRAICFLFGEAVRLGKMNWRSTLYLLLTVVSSQELRGALRRRLPFLSTVRTQ